MEEFRASGLIYFREFEDKRGCLSVVESGLDIPFEIFRVFWIYDVPRGETRGGHSHDICEQVLIPINGSVDILLESNGTMSFYEFSNTDYSGLYVAAGDKITMSNFSHDAILLVLASTHYDAEDYHE